MAMVADENSCLPEKESIAPNQHSWPETAAQMGEKHSKKHCSGKVDSALTAQHIGEPNRKWAADEDPYGAGEQSGKCAKPDACSISANARACTAQEQVILKADPLPATFPPMSHPLPQPTLLPPLPASLPAVSGIYNTYYPPSALSQPAYSGAHPYPFAYLTYLFPPHQFR